MAKIPLILLQELFKRIRFKNFYEIYEGKIICLITKKLEI